MVTNVAYSLVVLLYVQVDEAFGARNTADGTVMIALMTLRLSCKHVSSNQALNERSVCVCVYECVCVCGGGGSCDIVMTVTQMTAMTWKIGWTCQVWLFHTATRNNAHKVC